MAKKIGIIGFGEAGSTFAEEFAERGHNVSTYDILIEDNDHKQKLQTKAQGIGIRLCDSIAAAIENAELIFSAVTAASSIEVATEVSKTVTASQILFDINSVSLSTKQKNAELIHQAGGNYVDVAVMGPVPPTRLNVSLLISGNNAKAAAELLNSIGMNAKAVGDKVGTSSAIKMCRSVVVKGLEAITLECFYAAKHFGAEQEVLTSLQQTFPGLGWGEKEPNYMLSRIAEHGRRRAAEMRESAATIKEAGIEPRMANAIAETEDWLIMQMQEKGIRYADDFDWNQFLENLQT